MTTIEYVVGAILLAIAVALIVCITMQRTRRRGLSHSLVGSSAESYYSQNKGMTKQRMLNTITIVLAVVFCVLVLLLYVLHSDKNSTDNTNSAASAEESSVAAVSEEPSSADAVSEVVSETEAVSE